MPLQVSHIRVQRSKQLLKQGVLENGSIDIKWVKKILRDHYEDTFLEGPYFNAALPDFLSICIHSSPADFTWGITASSTIFILPCNQEHLPVVWWTPVTPCTGLYIPIFIHGVDLPEIVSRTGTFGKVVADPSKAGKDTFLQDSYWWTFRELLEIIKGDEHGSKFNVRQKIARSIFDDMEKKWEIEVEKVEKEAIILGRQGRREK